MDLAVDTATLRTTARRLREAVSVADEVHGHAMALKRLGDGVGDHEGQAAVDRFLTTWAYGMGLVHDDATTLADLLGRTADAYEQLERGIAEGCGG